MFRHLHRHGPGLVPHRSLPDPLRQTGLIAAAVVAYFGVRGLTEGREPTAVRNANRLFAVEKWLGLDWEETLQAPARSWWLLRDIMNWIYIWGHWPVISVAAVYLYRCHRHDYLVLRNAFLVSGIIGLVIFAAMPVAPPRLAGLGLLDTVTDHSHAYRLLQPPQFVNRYAAVPSLHAGWNLLLGLTLHNVFVHRVGRLAALASPALMALAVVATANHFVLDVFAGFAVSLVGYAVALRFTKSVVLPQDGQIGQVLQLGRVIGVHDATESVEHPTVNG